MPPILTVDLFPEVCGRLMELLRSLTVDEWLLPTSNCGSQVLDLVAVMA